MDKCMYPPKEVVDNWIKYCWNKYDYSELPFKLAEMSAQWARQQTLNEVMSRIDSASERLSEIKSFIESL